MSPMNLEALASWQQQTIAVVLRVVYPHLSAEIAAENVIAEIREINARVRGNRSRALGVTASDVSAVVEATLSRALEILNRKGGAR